MYILHDGETIKDVKGFEGHYAVTDHGRVWSYKRKKWLLPFDTGFGYPVVKLSLDGKGSDKKVHRLVAEAFVANPHNKPQVNHINGIKDDNRASNLCFVTARENIQHACDQGLSSVHRLSLKDKIIICQIYDRCDVTMTYLAMRYGISSPGIHYIIKAYGDQVGHA